MRTRSCSAKRSAFSRVLHAPRAVVDEDAERGGEAGRLARPVVEHRPRRDDERRPQTLGAMEIEKREDLHRLPQPHVVRQAPAEPEAAQVREPPQRASLVLAQRAVERRRRIDRLHAVEQAQLLARLLERGIDRHAGVLLRQRRDEPRLRLREAERLAGRLGERAPPLQSLRPLLRNLPDRSVREDHRAPVLPDRREHLGEGERRPVEARVHRHVEPVDPARDAEREARRAPVELPVDLDAPPEPEERARRIQQIALGDPVAPRDRPRAQRFDLLDGVELRHDVPLDDPPPGAIDEAVPLVVRRGRACPS